MAILSTQSWQCRALYAFAAYQIASNMYDSATMGLWLPHSVQYIIADITGVRVYLSVCFLVCCAAYLPFLLAQLRPHIAPRWSVLLVCAASFAAALMWIGSAFVSRDDELDMLRFEYIRQGIEACVFMLVIAANRNDARKHKHGLNHMRRERGSNNRVALK